MVTRSSVCDQGWLVGLRTQNYKFQVQLQVQRFNIQKHVQTDSIWPTWIAQPAKLITESIIRNCFRQIFCAYLWKHYRYQSVVLLGISLYALAVKVRFCLTISDDQRCIYLDCSHRMAFTVAEVCTLAAVTVMNVSRDNTRSAGHQPCHRVQVAVGNEPTLIIENR